MRRFLLGRKTRRDGDIGLARVQTGQQVLKLMRFIAGGAKRQSAGIHDEDKDDTTARGKGAVICSKQ